MFDVARNKRDYSGQTYLANTVCPRSLVHFPLVRVTIQKRTRLKGHTATRDTSTLTKPNSIRKYASKKASKTYISLQHWRLALKNYLNPTEYLDAPDFNIFNHTACPRGLVHFYVATPYMKMDNTSLTFCIINNVYYELSFCACIFQDNISISKKNVCKFKFWSNFSSISFSFVQYEESKLKRL